MTHARDDQYESLTLPEGGRRIHVVQGEYRVSGKERDVFTTLLGSCVAACIWDPVEGIGGMNHFLLPGDGETDGLRYGVNAMELLINGLLRGGARRDRLQAKLFGGARVMGGLSDIGRQNAHFAEGFLRAEGIPNVGGSLGGQHGRRIQFWPVSGRARQLFLPAEDIIDVERQQRPARPAAAPSEADAGAVELF